MKSGLTKKKLDLFVITFFSCLALIISQLLGKHAYFRGTFGVLLFTLPSIIYLFLRQKKPVRKIVIGSLLLGTLLGFFFEFMMQSGGGYDVVSNIFPKLFATVPIDSVVAHTVMTALILTFYEHFIANSKAAIKTSRWKHVLGLALFLDVLVIVLHYVSPGILVVPYPYATFASIALIPVAIKVYRHPDYSSKLLALTPFFFLTFMFFMIPAIHFGWWLYPSTTRYIGWVFLPTKVKFPFEELFFWMFFYAPAIATYYDVAFKNKQA